jgi:hypothetical protein
MCVFISVLLLVFLILFGYPACADCLIVQGLIAEVILYSEGFESSKNLAQKMTQMYKLCSEQLSQQDHYDFGMRALKSVLVMAGSLKRQNPDKDEDVVLIRALRDSNLPKFLKDDAILFKVILLMFVVLKQQKHAVNKGTAGFTSFFLLVQASLNEWRHFYSRTVL